MESTRKVLLTLNNRFQVSTMFSSKEMSSPWQTSAKRQVSTIKLAGFVFLFVLLNATTTSSLEVSINEDFYQPEQQEELDPCNFMSIDNPPGYCTCDLNEPEKEENAKCMFGRNPTAEEWKAIGQFKNVEFIELKNYPALAMTQLPPPSLYSGMERFHYFTIKRAAIHVVPSYAFGNSTTVSYIDLTDNSIHTLSSNSFANLINATLINLSENNLTEINRGVFVNLPKLKELVLTKNGIQTMHDNALQDLRKLTDLALQYNQLSVITREVFYGLQNLMNLDLSRNAIKYIGDHVFAEMPLLADLDLSENRIKLVSPTAFEGLTQLKRLNLKDNEIVKLQPLTFAHLNEIHFLDLRNNELETLNEGTMQPIYKNLRNSNMNLLVDGNRFLCDCRIIWITTLYNETESMYVRDHIQRVTCNLFDNVSKHVAAASSSSATFYPSESSSSDIKMLTNPPEETTTYAFESEKFILNLTASDLNCPERGAEIEKGSDKNHHKNHDGSLDHHTSSQKSHDTPYSTYHHPKFAGDNHRHTATEWDANSESHQRDHHHTGGISSEEHSGVNSGVHHQISALNEPQATAALEGEDVGSSSPKRTSAGDQKVDTARVSSNYPDNSSVGAKAHYCDSCFLVSIVVSIFMTLILM